jgi:hypothetical protein
MVEQQPSRVTVLTYHVVRVVFWVAAALGPVAFLFLLFIATDVRIGTVEISDPAMRERVVVAIALLVFWAVTMFGLHQLRGLVASAHDGDPFTDANVQRVRLLGGVFLANPLVGAVVTSVASEAAGFGGTMISIDVPYIVAGLCLLVLAEVFARGVRMRTDLDGTV